MADGTGHRELDEKHRETDTSAPDAPRPLRPALWRGWRRRCPSCGAGPLFSGFLTVRDTCPVCSEKMRHHKAKDIAVYLTILIVGLVMAPGLYVAYVTFQPDPLVLATTFTIGCVALSLYLLPRLKGATVAYQWAKRLHGFKTG